jgi:hypothetical protein
MKIRAVAPTSGVGLGHVDLPFAFSAALVPEEHGVFRFQLQALLKRTTN